MTTKPKGASDTTEVLKKTVETLPVELTAAERGQRGIELSEVLDEIAKEESNQDSLKASMKSKKAALEAKRDALAFVVRSGKEMQSVDVEDVADFKAGKVSRVRLDTGEIVHERELMDEERQTSFAAH